MGREELKGSIRNEDRAVEEFDSEYYRRLYPTDEALTKAINDVTTDIARHMTLVLSLVQTRDRMNRARNPKD